MSARPSTDDRDETAQLAAIEALTEENGPELVPQLIRALGTKSWRVRKAVIAALAHQDGAQAIAAVVQAMRAGHRDLGVLNGAIEVLAQTGVDILAAVREFLTGPAEDLRAYAAIVLGAQNNIRAVPDLLHALNDPDPNVRYHVIEALGMLRAGAAVDALTEVAQSRDFFLAFPALAALGAIGDCRVAHRLVPLLNDQLLQVAVVETLGHLGDEEIVGLLAGLLNAGDVSAGAVAGALMTLHARYEEAYHEGDYVADLVKGIVSEAGTQNLIAHIRLANGGDLRPLAVVLGWLDGAEVESTLSGLLDCPAVRDAVTEALVRRGSRVTGLLLDRMVAEEVAVRRAVVLALGRIGDRQAVPALLSALRMDDDLAVSIAGALAMIADARAYPCLVEMLGHPVAAVRQAVVSALNSLGHANTAADLVELLKHPDPLARESAVRIAGYFDFPDCTDLLLTCCRDLEDNVRRAAVECLPNIENVRAQSHLLEAMHDRAPGVRAAAARGLGQCHGPETVPALLTALGDSDAWVRYFAATSAGQRVCTQALTILNRLADDDPGMQVRVAATEAIGLMGGADEIPILTKLAEAPDGDLARAALSALGTLAHPEALPTLIKVASAAEPSLRAHAIQALGRSGLADAVSVLRRPAFDSDPAVVRTALAALEELATPDAVNAVVELTAAPAWREVCIAALARLGAAQSESVARGLQHQQSDVRRAVVAALARVKNPQARKCLRAALDDAEESVRCAAISALAHGRGLARR